MSGNVRVLVLPFVLVVSLLSGCGGKAEVGEGCSQTGKTDECVDGAICDTDKSGPVCLKSCTDDAQCASTQACNGVSGTNTKACHTK